MIQALFLGLALCPASPQAQEFLLTFSDGSSRIQADLARDREGNPVFSGSYREWDKKGTQRTLGQFTEGQREGKWEVFHTPRTKESTGNYAGDQRTDRWTMRDATGRLLARGRYNRGERTGTWKLAGSSSGTYASSTLTPKQRQSWRAAGMTLDKLRHGPWVFHWSNGRVMAEGHYNRGQKVGDWLFWHPDGTYDPWMISGQYRDGDRVNHGGEAWTPDGTFFEPVAPQTKNLVEAAAFAGLFHLQEKHGGDYEWLPAWSSEWPIVESSPADAPKELEIALRKELREAPGAYPLLITALVKHLTNERLLDPTGQRSYWFALALQANQQWKGLEGSDLSEFQLNHNIPMTFTRHAQLKSLELISSWILRNDHWVFKDAR